MGFFSKLFGKNRNENALHDAYERIRQIIEDETLQLELIHPMAREVIEKCPAYDRDPHGVGPFGYIETNPIPVNGPIGEVAYLSKLETKLGQRILFHRIGAIDKIDVFEAVTFSGTEWFILYLDFYHPRRSRLTPDGFRFMEGIGQFSGFHEHCGNFPYDFLDMKKAQAESGLSLAYMAYQKIEPYVQQDVYRRPPAHQAKLDKLEGILRPPMKNIKPMTRIQQF